MKTTDIYRRLELAFESAGMGTTQVQIAKALKVRQQSVSKWKGGINHPDHSTLYLAAQLTGVSLEWLSTGKGEMRPEKPNPELVELLDRLNALDPETRKKALLILDALTRG